MKKTLIIAAAAIAVSGVAYAGDLKTGANDDPRASEDIIAAKLAETASADATKLGAVENGKFDGMGGPLEDEMGSGFAPGTRSITMSQPAATFRPIHRGSYPACSATVTDNCQQR